MFVSKVYSTSALTSAMVLIVPIRKMIEFIKTIVLVIVVAYMSCIVIACKKILGLCNLLDTPIEEVEYMEESLIRSWASFMGRPNIVDCKIPKLVEFSNTLDPSLSTSG